MRKLLAAAFVASALLLTAACTTAEPDTAAKAPAATTPTPTFDADAIRESAGLPPMPIGAERQAFLDGLNAIDVDIVHGKDDKAIDRGLNQCQSIKRKYERAKLISLTNSRFTSPNHPDGHGLAKAERVLDVVHTNLCPSF